MLEVCLTVDIEFDIAGAFVRPYYARPLGEPHVYCPAGGRENGLAFLLDTFARYDIRATFFVEVAQVAYFSDAPMGRVVERIRAAGHDVQMHLHPCWSAFHDPDWRARLQSVPPNDHCDGRTLSDLVGMIEEGLGVFTRWGLPRPIAFRSGNLRSDRTLYRALSECGIAVSSSIGLAIAPPAEPELQLTGGRTWIEGVLELPVLTYRELAIGRWRRNRLLTIAAASSRESIALLRQALQTNAGPVIIITHAFEYIHGAMRSGQARPNGMTQRRLTEFCAFLRENRDTFSSVTFAQAHESWLAAGPIDGTVLRPPLPAVLRRMFENKLADRLHL